MTLSNNKIPLRVLIVEDSEDDTDLVIRAIRKGGYELVFERVETAEALSNALSLQQWDLIISDFAMPSFDGLSALKIAQESALDLPFILVSGTITEENAVSAMKSGAHDFITKFNLARLVPAIERELREAEVRREHRRADEELKKYHSRLESLVEERTVNLKRTNEKMSEILASITDAYYCLDSGWRFTDLNRLAEQLFSRSAGDLLGRVIWEEFPQAVGTEIYAKYHTAVEKNLPVHFETLSKVSGRWHEIHAYPRVDGLEIYSRDISERKGMEEEIRHMAHHDALTDLPNRRLFLDLFKIEAAQARRNKKKLAVLFLDVDRFKEINDTLGHEIGDELLKKASSRLKASIRESDTVARIGGDEFNILVSDITREEDAADVAGKIVENFRKSFMISGHELRVTCSMGISIYPDDSDETDTLLRYADIAMYSAKENGRNRYYFYNPGINVRSLDRIRLENSLRQTLERGELSVHYQPLIDIKSGNMVSAEALVRWQHPEMGLLEPGRFIHLAEESGFITEIDEWVLQTVCRQARAWQDAGMPPVSITVNISARHFQNPRLVDTISHTLKENGLPPGCLDIEITESLAMSNIARTARQLKELAGMGVHISIDDFGTGYSSLNYLKRLPINRLKIDKSFIQDIAADPDDRAIIDAVTVMAHTMKMTVIAEGVETEDQLSFLRQSGCDEAQGFLFSEPLPPKKFKEFVTAGRGK